ncbi:MAG: hypothetical protein LKJ69_04840 [Lactobacillus sp.]|jgi:hypothetical protein|nr:hypothetical protein [Lactobacillus sp.]MCI2032710.1 hypothetical protein [Lactobacillus sp.]
MIDIIEGLDIHYRNVVTGLLLTDAAHLDEDIQNLLDEIAAEQTIVDDYLYVIESDFRRTDAMTLSVVVPIAEDKPVTLPQGFRFQSYYQLLDLIGLRLVDADSSQLEEQVMRLMAHFADRDLEPTTPLIMRPHQLHDHHYSELYVGQAERQVSVRKKVPKKHEKRETTAEERAFTHNHYYRATGFAAVGAWIKNSFNYAGSSSRSEYWWPLLFTLLYKTWKNVH